MSLLDEAVVLNDGSLMPKVGVTVTSDEVLPPLKSQILKWGLLAQ